MFFDAVRNNRRIVQLFLVLITLPFALWGLDSYVGMGGATGTPVATIGKQEITEAELKASIANQTESLVAQYGPTAAAIAESESFRAGVLDRIVNQRVLEQETAKDRLMVSDALVRSSVLAVPDFQEAGRFSLKKYQEVLAANGMTETLFENRIRKNLLDQMLLAPIAQSTRAPQVIVQRWLALQDETREVASVFIDPKPFEAKVRLAEGAAQKYYDDNRAKFMLPEQVKIEYVALTPISFTKDATVSDADAKKFYDDNAARYTQPEERRASHILIAAGADAAAKAEARKKADAVLLVVRANPADFAKEAKAQSADTISAEKGGDLDFFAADAMAKPFSDVAFKLKKGEISDVVETEYGFHIIQLTDVRGGIVKPFEAVKAEVVEELVHQKASKAYGEAVEVLTDLVYNQPDSLKPAADKLKLPIEKSDWIEKGGKQPGMMSDPKLQAAIFSEKVLKERANSEPIDLGDGMLLSIRVAEHKPATERPFAEVKTEIVQALTRTEALNMAQADGQEKLVQLQKGEALKLAWAAPKSMKRGDGLAPAAQKAVFGLNSAKLPAYAGVSLPEGGYNLYRVDKVTKPVIQDNDPRVAGSIEAYAQVVGEADARAYMSALRSRIGVTINLPALPKAGSE